MQQEPDDITVIQTVLQGRQSAFAILVNRYEMYVFTLVLRYTANREEAEELAQDVFVKAYKYLADFKGHSKFSTWLYTIVHTTCLSHLRKQNNKTILLEEKKMINLSDQSCTTGNISDTLDHRSQKQLINTAINQLPQTDAEIITLFYQAEQTLEEIGSILGLTTNNVKVRLFRARQKLKEILQDNKQIIS